MAIPSKLNTQYSGGCMRYIVVKGIEYKSYMVDIYGDIYSVKGDGSLYRMKKHISNAGYYRVSLKRDLPNKMYTVHRIVAETYLDNPFGYPIVNHKDYNKLNNEISNLEWCSYSHNNKHTVLRMTTHHSYKKVAQIDLSTNKIIKIWDGISLACRELGIYGSNIAKVCSGERNHAGGFGWKYI